jgi:hypothetical protein
MLIVLPDYFPGPENTWQGSAGRKHRNALVTFVRHVRSNRGTRDTRRILFFQGKVTERAA